LEEGLVDFGIIVHRFRIKFHVVDDSDDLAPFRISADIQADLFSERLLVLQVTMDKLLVYDDHAGRGGVIRIRKFPATEQRDARGLEVAGANDGVASGEALVRRQVRLTFDLEGDSAWSGGRQIGGNGHDFGGGNALETSEEILNEKGLLDGILVTRGIEIEARSQEMVGAKAQILMLDEAISPVTIRVRRRFCERL
jgi:hypothetical protein